jgi:CheY-like chemotaxis protein
MNPLPLKILLAEDDNDLREILIEQLMPLGAEVIAASNGKEAWSILQQGTFQLVISDVKMPEMSGLQLLSNARGQGMRVPFMLMSGLLLDTLPPQKESDQPLRVIEKPTRQAVLIQAAREMIKG